MECENKIKEMQTDSDQELMLSIQQGSLESLGTLYDRHRRMVYRTALAITSDPEAAADLLQDVFAQMINTYEEIESMDAWLQPVFMQLDDRCLFRVTRFFFNDNFKKDPAA